ncbi:MAG: SRPBCC domain-containing protein [Halobacteria archaeon]|nr:SRPBCC domain-containing protein [Halobacteria archaeon]
MKEIRTQIEIDAPPGAVWDVLTDFEAYDEWNPFIPRAEGEIEEGEKIEVEIQPPDSRAMEFNPTLLKVIPDQELRWKGKLFFRGLFDGEHVFVLEEKGGSTVFIQKEEFSGILVGLILNEDEIRRGFESMNEALKERIEG